MIIWISKSETISETFVTFTMFEWIIFSILIASKLTSCWISFNSIAMMNEHRIKLNELKNDTRLCFESSENENINSTTFLISTTWRFIFMYWILNQIETSNTLFSMIDIQDLLHSIIIMTCIRHYSFNFFMRILSFVQMSIIIILNLSHQRQSLSLSRFVHINLHQSIKHFKHFALKINTHVRFLYLTISFWINMHVYHRHFRSSALHRHLKIWHHMFRHRSYFESQSISSRNYRNLIKFIQMMKNSRIQTIILISNWKSFLINANVSNYHHMRT